MDSRYLPDPIPNRQLAGQPCDFDLPLPEWKASPDGEKKERVAAEVLEELTSAFNDNLKAAYIRDFNLSDTGMDIYLVYTDGDTFVQGCGFSAAEHPHCMWHLYGQGELETTIQGIMERPYRLYPPPIGKP